MRLRWKLLLVGAAALAATLAAAAGAGAYLWLAYPGCDASRLRPPPLGRPSVVFDADGAQLAVLSPPDRRRPVPLARVSPWVVRATVAVEDRRFFTGPGVDWRGTARAAWRNLRARRVVEGGSTITQQLVRGLYLGRERTFGRKLRESCLALKLARAWPRRRILAEYLNRVYYGAQAYGVAAAARTYFDRDPEDLTLEQAALLAGLPQAPSLLDPFVYPRAARARRAQVLAALRATGRIAEARYRRALRAPLGLRRGRVGGRTREPLFVARVVDELVARYGAATVEQGGLRVRSTLAPRRQALARAAADGVLGGPRDPAVAVAAVDPATGFVRALASRQHGADTGELDLATMGRRQAGSAFKPFALAAAVERGADPDATTYLSAPFAVRLPDGGRWLVRNDGDGYAGLESLTRATLRSDNTVYARLSLDLGAEAVVEMAERLGVRSPLEPYASAVLGTNEVSPLDMASAYATLAAGGIYRAPTTIARVELPGGRVERADTRGRRVLAAGAAAVVTRVLEANVRSGTGTAAAIGRPAAGKTGTTSSFADAWFVGYTPQLAAAVWVGYPRAALPMRSVHGRRVYGGTLPAEVWRRFVGAALAPLPWRPWPRPSGPAPRLLAYEGRHRLANVARRAPPPPVEPAAPEVRRAAAVTAAAAQAGEERTARALAQGDALAAGTVR